MLYRPLTFFFFFLFFSLLFDFSFLIRRASSGAEGRESYGEVSRGARRLDFSLEIYKF